MALLVPHFGRTAAPRLFAAVAGGSSSSGRRAFSSLERRPRCAPRTVLSSALGQGSSSSLPAIARRAFSAAAARREAQPPGKPNGGIEGVLKDIKREVESKLGGTGGIVEKGKAALRDGGIAEKGKEALRQVQGRGDELRQAANSAGEQALKKGQNAVDGVKQEATDRAVAYGKEKLSEDIMTLPNVLTMLRLASCPVLGYLIATGQLKAGVALLFVAGASDALDGYIARKRGSFTVFGSIADPAADKALMTTMVVALAYRGLLPMPLAVLIIGRDVLLVISAFFIRFRTLSKPRTLARYFDPTLPSATVVPTAISKANTALQLVLVGTATLMPLLPPVWQSNLELPWTALIWIVSATTVWSGLGYLGGGGSQKVLAKAAEVASVAAKRSPK